MFVGLAEEPGTCRTASHVLGCDGFLLLLDHNGENEHRFWLGTATAEIRTVLLASALGQVDAAVREDKNMFF